MIVMDTKESQNLIFEQYKIAVEMADRISSRREWANKFFLSANSIIFVFLTAQTTFNEIHIFISIFGMVLSYVWELMIMNYKNLNSAKFGVINEIEERLPFQIYKSEWNKLHWVDKKVNYSKLTHIERKLPRLFVLFYFILLIYVLIKMYGSYLCK